MNDYDLVNEYKVILINVYLTIILSGKNFSPEELLQNSSRMLITILISISFYFSKT